MSKDGGSESGVRAIWGRSGKQLAHNHDGEPAVVLRWSTASLYAVSLLAVSLLFYNTTVSVRKQRVPTAKMASLPSANPTREYGIWYIVMVWL